MMMPSSMPRSRVAQPNPIDLFESRIAAALTRVSDTPGAPLMFMEALDDETPISLMEVTRGTQPLPWAKIDLKGFKPGSSDEGSYTSAVAYFEIESDTGALLKYSAFFRGSPGRGGIGGNYSFSFSEDQAGVSVASIPRGGETSPEARAQAAARTKGAALTVFATIIQIMKKFVAMRQPDKIEFSAGESSRSKLYVSLAKRFGSAQYEFTTPGTYTSSTGATKYHTGHFYLTRKAAERMEEPITNVADLPADHLVILIKLVNQPLTIIVPKDYDERDEEEVFARVRQIYARKEDARRALEKAQASGDYNQIEKARKRSGHKYEVAQAISAKNAIKQLFKLEGGKPPSITRMNLTALYRYLDQLIA